MHFGNLCEERCAVRHQHASPSLQCREAQGGFWSEGIKVVRSPPCSSLSVHFSKPSIIQRSSGNNQHIHTIKYKIDNEQGPTVWHRELCSLSCARKWQPTLDSYLKNPMDRGAWWTTAHGVAKEADMTEHTAPSPIIYKGTEFDKGYI